MRIYIASSWKNQHGVEMLTTLLRTKGHEVVSWIENNYGENHSVGTGKADFETWVNSSDSDQAFKFDSEGAMGCDVLIYYGVGGKDASAECGICYGAQQHAISIGGRRVPMLGLWAKGEDFGLMRKMFDEWAERWDDLIKMVENIETELFSDD